MSTLSKKLTTGDGRELTLGAVVQYYRDVVNLSVPTKGKIQKLGDDIFSLRAQFSAVDCDNLEAVKTHKIYSLTTKSLGQNSKCIDHVRCMSDPFEVSELALVTSENGRFIARLKSPKQKDNNGDGPQRQLLEIWDRSRLLKTIDTSDLEAHSSINCDPVFGGMSWLTAGDQDKLVYVCQRKRPKSTSFFKDAKPSKDGEPEKTTRGEEHLKREDWGESLNGIEHTMIAVLDVANNCQITTIDAEDHSLGQPQWLDSGSKIVCVGYPEVPRRLGLVFCNRYPSKLMIYDLTSESREPLTEIKSSDQSFHTPRSNNSGDEFVFLSNTSSGAHAHAVKLSSYNIKTMQQRSLPVDLSGTDLFIDTLPSNCFSIDDKHILFRSNDHLNQHMYIYTVDSNKVTEIKFPTPNITILDFRYNIILAIGSDIDATPTLFTAVINTVNTSDVVAWHQIEDCIHVDEVEHESYKISTEDGSFISAILTQPNLKVMQVDDKMSTSRAHLPTVVIVHGGPHSAALHCFLPVVVFYSRLGLKVLLINYRGSTGVTEEYTLSLTGKIGIQDVSDCLTALRYFTQNKLIDPSKLIIQGGSHGGFLSCHLSSQEEFKFTSAIIRNPVVDLPAMFGTTDIPDWITGEGLGINRYDPTWLPSPDDMVRLRNQSPMYKAKDAKVPTLVLLGTKDRRVPMFQGDRWADALRANGVEVQCKVYQDEHGLAKPDTMADSTVSAAVWMLDHLPK